MSHALKQDRLLAAGQPLAARMPAVVILVHAAAVCRLFLPVLGHATGFFGGIAVPKGTDQEPRTVAAAAVAIELLLLSLFAVQHTVMARPYAFEEHHLTRNMGGTYTAYRARVPALIPWPALRRQPPGSWQRQENDRRQAR